MSFMHTPEHSSPESLWDTLGHFIAGAISMFGDAKTLAERMFLQRKEYRLASAWLWRCEELLRRLIFIDAVKALQRGTRALFAAKKSAVIAETRSVVGDQVSGSASPGITVDPGAPATWRVSFALTPRLWRRQSRARAHWRRGERFQFGEFVDIDAAKEQKLAFAQQRRALFALPPLAARSVGVQPATGRQQAALISSHTLAQRLEALSRAASQRERQAKRLGRWLTRHRAQAALFTRPSRSYLSLQRKPGDHAVADAAYFAEAAWRACDSS